MGKLQACVGEELLVLGISETLPHNYDKQGMGLLCCEAQKAACVYDLEQA